MVYLTRRYRFAASHRLHSDGLTEEQNRQVYGKCNNPFGHGHNYVLEVTVAGPVEPATGMVYDLAKLDGLVQREVLDRFDKTYLNLDVETFRHVVPTTENLCVEVFRLLDDRLKEGRTKSVPSLARVRLEETSSNYFEYAGGKELPRGR